MMKNARQDLLKTFPVLNSKRLCLREITEADIPAIFAIFGNDTVTKYYNCDTLKEEKEAEEFVDWYATIFEQKRGIRWGITLKPNSKVIGTCGFNFFNPNGRANLGYDLNEDYWGQGIITEAVKMTMSYGFRTLQINRIEADVMLENAASIKVLDKVGFKREGIMREYGYWKGKYHDLYLYSLLKREFLSFISGKMGDMRREI